jgi:hypothetical protein
MLKMGTIALDGTKIHANTSRHSALSYEHAGKIEGQLQAEVAELLARAEVADKADMPDGLSIPEELARREKRLAKLAEAPAKIEARAKKRYEREKTEHDAKLAAREAKATDKKPGGRTPQPPTEGALPTDQINLTDEESRHHGAENDANVRAHRSSRHRTARRNLIRPSGATAGESCVITVSAANPRQRSSYCDPMAETVDQVTNETIPPNSE